MSATTGSDPIVIAGAARTAIGGFQGQFAPLTASELGRVAITAALGNAGAAPDQVEEVVMGCVLPAGQGQAPARQAALGAGLPEGVGATTINKMCGSGMKAAMIACDALKAGSADIILAGGMESMTNAPYLLEKARAGYRMGHGQIKDHMFLDGLEDAYDRGKLMGVFAEETAQAFQFTRQAQDDFAIASLSRAQAAIAGGAFASEIAPVTVTGRQGQSIFDTDEQPGRGDAQKIPRLKPAFREDGTITAANASSISDGAAALVLTRQSVAERQGLNIRALVLGQATYALKPSRFTIAPIGACRKLLDQLEWSAADVDLWEINEAFAVVTMAAMRELGLDHDKVNIHGGACALGHPIGASGARILVTLLAALERHGLKTGIASLCIGGGEATAMAIERVG